MTVNPAPPPEPTPDAPLLTGPVASAELSVRLLSTTDLHGALLPYDYGTRSPCNSVGLTRTAALIEQARREAPNVLLFDSGDFLQGSPLADRAAESDRPEDHPSITAMNTLHYDAAALGNHDFNFGLDVLARSLAAAQFPVLCANIAPGFLPWVLLERRLTDGAGRRQRVRIGVFGVAPPQTLEWDAVHLAGRVSASDMVIAATEAVAALQEAGADMVVALCHGGIEPGPHRPGRENTALQVAELDGVDAVLGGHTHAVFPSSRRSRAVAGVDPGRGLLSGKPAVIAGSRGSHLGVVDLVLRRRGGRWRPLRGQSEARPIATATRRPKPLVADDPVVLDAVGGLHTAALAELDKPLGHLSYPLHSYFALAAPCRALEVIAKAQAAELRRVMAGTEAADLPVLSSVAPFKAGGQSGPEHFVDVRTGPLRHGDVDELYPYANAFRAVRVNGARLLDWLERAASVFPQLSAGRARGSDPLLFSTDTPPYGFEVIYGLTYRIDLSSPPLFDPATGAQLHDGPGRVRDVRLSDRPLRPETEVALATNSYRAGGGGGFPPVPGEASLSAPPIPVRELLRQYLEQAAPPDRATQVFSFEASVPTDVLVPTGPGAAAYADDAPGLTATGRTTAGFSLYRMSVPAARHHGR